MKFFKWIANIALATTMVFCEGDVDIVVRNPEICDNGIDDDTDGRTDCDDADCHTFNECVQLDNEICNNGIDDDGDGVVDCADADCNTFADCLSIPFEICDNSLDDDGDGLVDCDDPDCSSWNECIYALPEICDNGVDDNLDGIIDCDDERCNSHEDCILYDAKYLITFTSFWNETDHGTVPVSAHFTTVIGMSHNLSIRPFMTGILASVGVEELAETGGLSEMSNEIDGYISSGGAWSKLIFGVPYGPNISASGDLTVVEDRPYISLATKINPTPDWFIGIDAYRLFDGTIWVEDVTIPVGMYDAGTEDGDQFSLDNPASDPQENISPLDGSNASSLANGNMTVASLGEIQLTRIE